VDKGYARNVGIPCAVVCTVCGEPLAQEFIDAGFTDHGEDSAA